jgi:hypothetical protein
MKYQTKSIIVGRKKRNSEIRYDDSVRPCFIALFDMNYPHRQSEPPKKILEFEKNHKVIIRNLKEIHYLLEGNDLVVNDLNEIEVYEEKGHVIIECS